MGESVRGPDLMGAMIEGMEEIEASRPTKLPTQKLTEASIRRMRESLEEALETTADMGVTSFATKEAGEERPELPDEDNDID